ncbi:uncharacterized protein EV422DRAFT_205429 [Fimicolochytrium jonesii]|uniref:uncharacterized protein n=1 Tax=Fimicolochytrium jonesii TaxID=1396493 RepID=UPI0022FE7FC5|nr:uncharacterized protein EV422DRAFT_205429 [Fimicolochytrium jonesii]KAI8817780.1 hypothetical protein EV422DRAFT_205429 [Fimicolochytrium jonesii]
MLDIAKWTANVSATALTIARKFLSPTTFNEQLSFPYTLTPLACQLLPPTPHQSPEHPTPKKPTWKKHTCPFCIDTQTGEPKVLNGEHEWRVHFGTRGPKMRMGGGERARRGRRRESGGGDVSREEVAGRIDVY